MLLNIADVGVRPCVSAQDVRRLATQTVRKAVKLRHPPPPRVIAINDLTPGIVPVQVQIIRKEIQVDNLIVPIELGDLRQPSISAIIAAVCQSFEVTRLDIVSQRRTNQIAIPRQIIMYLARTYTTQTLPAIGKQLGGRDHTTVLHGVRKITKLRKTNAELDSVLKKLTEQLGAYHG